MSLQMLHKTLHTFEEEIRTEESHYENHLAQAEIKSAKRVDHKWSSCPEPATLEREILSGTHQQVRKVKVCCDHSGITVYGVSPSYYLKQLVTQTVQEIAPSIPLMNRVFVQTK